MPAPIEGRNTESLKASLATVLPLFNVARAHLQIGRSAWLYDASADGFMDVEAPIRFQGAIFSFPDGALTVAEPIGPTTRELLEAFLRIAVETVRTRDLLNTVFKTSLALSSNLNLRALLRDLMALTEEALGAEAGSVMLLDHTKSTLYWELAERDPAGVLERRSLPVGEGIAGTVAKTGNAMIVADAQRDLRVAKWVGQATGFQTRSILCVPMRFKGEVIGVLQVLNKTKGPFGKQDEELLELIAAEAGAAIENARLYGTLEERVRLRTEELSAANAQFSRTLDQLKATQTHLVQSEKMAALGKLVGGISHEINTPLGAITSNTNLLDRGFKRLAGSLDGQGKELLTTLDPLLQTNAEACRRISAIVKNLKTFARLDEAAWKSTDLREGMETTLTLVHHLHKGRIEMIREYEAIPPVECHSGQINQVFMNLLVNAIQAIEGSGKIWIRMGLDMYSVKVEIQDTGIGIADTHLPKIFDPGFTTKGVGVGTGLGLSICYQIINEHHGRIQASSQQGKGSTFTVLLPISSRKQ